MSQPVIESFLNAVRRRLDGGARMQVYSQVLLAASAAAVLWAIAWRIFGYAAPLASYAVIAVLAVISAIVWLIFSKRDIHSAAHSADGVFGLKDALVSWLDFRAGKHEGEVYQLAQRDLARRVESQDVKAVPIPSCRRAFTIASVLAAAAIGLALLPHSAAVMKRLADEQLAAARSKEIEKQVEEAIEEIIKSMSEEERELLNPAAMREWAKQLEATKDFRENEKQLARLEQQIAKAMQGLEARQDEAILKLAADELAKSSLADVRQLGKQLDAKDFDKAAEELKDMKPEAMKKMTPEELEQLRKNAAKTRDMAKRMADGARRKDFGKMKPGDNKNAKPSDAKPGDEQAMEEMLEELDEEAGDLAEELEDGEEMEEGDEELAEGVGEKMDGLGKRVRKLGARQKAKSKLGALRSGLADARQFSQGRSQSLGLAQMQSKGQGGLAPGKGSDQSRRQERDEFKDNGNMTQLKGKQTGEGPSSTTTESAESGSGIAGRANVAKQREFKQQFESLVHRDDIPEALKLGVREYFEKVHETETSEK